MKQAEAVVSICNILNLTGSRLPSHIRIMVINQVSDFSTFISLIKIYNFTLSISGLSYNIPLYI